MLLGTIGAARRYQGFPVVTNLHDMLLIGYISRSMLDDVLAKVRNASQRKAFRASAPLRRINYSCKPLWQVRHTLLVCVVHRWSREFGGGHRPLAEYTEHSH